MRTRSARFFAPRLCIRMSGRSRRERCRPQAESMNTALAKQRLTKAHDLANSGRCMRDCSRRACAVSLGMLCGELRRCHAKATRKPQDFVGTDADRLVVTATGAGVALIRERTPCLLTRATASGLVDWTSCAITPMVQRRDGVLRADIGQALAATGGSVATATSLAATTRSLAATARSLAGTTRSLAATTRSLAATTRSLAATARCLAARRRAAR